MIHDVLATTVRLTAGLNEFTLLFNTWIISHPTDDDPQHHHTRLLPALCTIIFAISEPLHTFLLVRLPLEAAFLAFMIPVSQGLVTLLLWETAGLVALERQRAAGLDMRHTDKTNEAQCEAAVEISGPGPITIDCAQDLGYKTFWAFAFAHIQTAAATTASLLLLAQNMEATKIESPALHTFLVICALVYFGLSRVADYSFARYARLPFYIGQNGIGDAMKQVKNLLWLIAIRAGVRAALGMAAISGPFGTDGADVEYFFAETTLHTALMGIPTWAWWAVSALCVCLMILARISTQRAEANVREGRLD